LSYDLVSIVAGVDAKDIPPAGLQTRDDLYERLTGELLTASSRNGYLAFVIERVIARYGFTALSFLDSKPWDAPGSVVGKLFAHDDIAAVVTVIDELFDRIKFDPDMFVALDSSISCCAKHLLEAADQAEVSLHPMIDGGDDIRSVLNLLRSFQDFCRRNREQNRRVLFVQMC
jgi:hypothetical protein